MESITTDEEMLALRVLERCNRITFMGEGLCKEVDNLFLSIKSRGVSLHKGALQDLDELWNDKTYTEFEWTAECKDLQNRYRERVIKIWRHPSASECLIAFQLAALHRNKNGLTWNWTFLIQQLIAFMDDMIEEKKKGKRT